MAYPKFLVFLVALSLGLSECAFVDTLKKCHINDNDCLKALVQNSVKEIAKSGISELNIPPFDPFEIKNMNISIKNILNMILVEGTAKGLQNCAINKFEANIEKLHAYLDIMCDHIVIKSTYKVRSESPAIKNLLGTDFHGEGNGKAKIENVKMTLDFPVKLVKRDGDTYFIGERKDMKYTVDIGKITFAADKLYLGDKESSKQIIDVLNQNWKVLLTSLGTEIYEPVIRVIYKFVLTFFKNFSTKFYIIEDLSQYIQ